MENWVIVGATSAIAESAARIWAERGGSLYLLGRSTSKLDTIAEDLRIRGAAAVHTQAFDACDYSQHEQIMQDAENLLGNVHGILIAHGTLPDQGECAADMNFALQEFAINGTSVMSLVGHAANYFEPKRAGVIAVISSVAGDRGRQSNYLYGSAKAAVTTFLQGVRNRLAACNVHVITIKPGFVDTPMTDGMDKSGLLWAQPETVAEAIVKGIENRVNVLYVPWFWRYIMLIITHIPEFIFKKLSL